MNTLADPFWLAREQTALLVIDVQERLIPTMPQEVYRRVLRSIEFLTSGARILGLPVLVTEQYPKGLGPTVPELASVGSEPVLEKLSFGCCGDGDFVARLQALNRPQILVTGMEAHVCVLQTVLGLLASGNRVHLVRDAIISRSKTDYLTALDVARQAGAVLTSAETALFQLLRSSTAPEFKAVSTLVKKRFAELS